MFVQLCANTLTLLLLLLLMMMMMLTSGQRSVSHMTLHKHKVPGRGQAVVYAVLSVCC